MKGKAHIIYLPFDSHPNDMGLMGKTLSHVYTLSPLTSNILTQAFSHSLCDGLNHTPKNQIRVSQRKKLDNIHRKRTPTDSRAFLLLLSLLLTDRS